MVGPYRCRTSCACGLSRGRVGATRYQMSLKVGPGSRRSMGKRKAKSEKRKWNADGAALRSGNQFRLNAEETEQAEARRAAKPQPKAISPQMATDCHRLKAEMAHAARNASPICANL